MLGYRESRLAPMPRLLDINISDMFFERNRRKTTVCGKPRFKGSYWMSKPKLREGHVKGFGFVTYPRA
jgi:hypothetical protein